jgi:hypothetical protein
MKTLLRSIWFVLRLRCDDAERLMSSRTSNDLNWSERNGLRFHRAICRSCRATQRTLNQLSDLLQTVDQSDAAPDASPIALDESAKQRLRSSLLRASKEETS